jgi:hypothetical protein
MTLPQSFEMMADLGTVTVCRLDAAIDYAAVISAADNVALRSALKTAEAALADIGDATREPGDDLAWCEARAAQALPAVRAALKATP